MFIYDDYDDNPNLFSEILPGLWQGGTAAGDQIHAPSTSPRLLKDTPLLSGHT
jgi:hypothetical protein